MVEKIIEGVGFLLFSRNGSGELELFVIEELESKPQHSKEKGMFSFPLETFEEGDVDYSGTILRLIREEVGAPMEEIVVSGIAQGYLQPIPGRPNVHIGYGYGLFTGVKGRFFVPGDKDIRFAGWWTMEALLRQHVRVEVRPILEHFAKNHLSAFLGELFQAVA